MLEETYLINAIKTVLNAHLENTKNIPVGVMSTNLSVAGRILLDIQTKYSESYRSEFA